MHSQSRKPDRFGPFAILGVCALLGLTGCWKKSGEAVVIAKDYLPALKASDIPVASPESTAPEGTASPAEEPAAVTEEESTDYPGGPAVDPRTTDHEQWIASVRMITDGRQIDVRLDQPRWEALKIGDRVQVRYRQGKYTGTVWSADLK